MDILAYFSISFIITLGVFVGAYVAKNASEELKVGARFIKTLSLVIAYIIIFLVSNNITGNIFLASFIPTAIIGLLFLVPSKARSYVLLSIVGAAFSYGLKKDLGYTVPSLAFIQMLCVGSMTYYLEKKTLIKSLSFKSLTILAIASLMFFIQI